MKPPFSLALGHASKDRGILDAAAELADLKAAPVAPIAGDLLTCLRLLALAEVHLAESAAPEELVGEGCFVLVDRVGQRDLVPLDCRQVVPVHRSALAVVNVLGNARRAVRSGR
jgi:hypothetical protein